MKGKRVKHKQRDLYLSSAYPSTPMNVDYHGRIIEPIIFVTLWEINVTNLPGGSLLDIGNIVNNVDFTSPHLCCNNLSEELNLQKKAKRNHTEIQQERVHRPKNMATDGT